MSVRTFVAPSRILFTDCTGTLESTPLAPADPRVCEQYRKLRARGECPRLQVVEKDGYYFTLNNTKLCLFRWLEQEGYCRRVRLERVPLKDVPESIQGLMVPPPLTPTNNNAVKDCQAQPCSPCSGEASRTVEDTSNANKGHGAASERATGELDRSDSGISSSSSSGSVAATPLLASKPAIDEVDEGDDDSESLETGQTQESDSEFDWSEDISASTDDDSTSEEDENGGGDDDEEGDEECNEKDKLLQ